MKRLTRPLLIVGKPQNDPNLRYLSGFSAPDALVFLQDGRQRHLVVPLLEYGRAKRCCHRSVQVWCSSNLLLRKNMQRSLAGWALGLLKKLDCNRIQIAADMPYIIVRQLIRSGIRVTMASDPLCPQRQVKNDEEMGHIHTAQHAAVRAMRTAVHMIAGSHQDARGLLRRGRHGLTSEHVRAAINRVLLDAECTGTGTIVAGGTQATDPHEQGNGPLYAGQGIVIDIFPQHMSSGYWGDLTRTVVKGKAAPRLKSMYHAVRAAQRAALATIKAGVTSAAVHKAAAAVLEHRGFKTGIIDGKAQGFIHGTGHGVGLEIHEAPGLGLRPGRLRAGNVVTVEPGLYYPDIGGIRIEDLVMVTRTGWACVVPCPYWFEV